MMKKVCYFLLILFSLCAFWGVKADESSITSLDDLPNAKCGSAVKSKGLASAADVKIAYETLEYKASDSLMYYFVDISILNLHDDVFIQVHNGKTGSTFQVDSSKANPEGVIKLRQKDTSEIVNYTFEVKARTVECYGTTLRTIKLTVPKYNRFSERAVCADIPDYYMCQTFVSYDIDSARFLDSVNHYKASLEKKDSAESNEGKTSAIASATKTISNNKGWIIGIILIAGVVATALVIKRKRSVL